MGYKEIDFENDCIAWVCHFGEEMRTRYIIDGFFKTADLIYEKVKDNKRHKIYEDDLVYPFLHLIRHGYELQLKMIMDNIKTFGEKYHIDDIDYVLFNECKYSHNLGQIYDFIKNNIYKVDDRIEGLVKNCLRVVESKLSDFLPEQDIDPYRYATDTEGNENLKDLNQVSFDNAIRDAEDFKNASDYILLSFSQLFDEYSLGTYCKRLSRNKIIQIAVSLPKYEKWKEPFFDDVRNEIKSKFNISYHTLEQAIKIIQNSRELSYYIGYKRKDPSKEIQIIKKCFDFNSKINFINDNNLSLSDKQSINIEGLQKRNSQCHNFITSLSNDDIFMVLTYYFMGHELKHSEQYNETMKIAENIYDPNNRYALESYFRGKLTSHTFIGHVLEGTRRSGDFEIFIDLYEYCKKCSLCNLEEWEKEYNRLVSFR